MPHIDACVEATRERLYGPRKEQAAATTTTRVMDE
jgi:hypothetical protein